MSIIHQYLDLAVSLAHEAGAYARGAKNDTLEIQSKTNDFDLVTHVDKHNEELLKNGVAKHFPSHDFLGEEGTRTQKYSEVKWVVDPIDGTLNYAHGLPIWCISIGVEVSGVIECGVIYDPSREEIFTSIRGEGAYRNGERITVSTHNDPSRSMYVTGFPYNISENPYNDIERFERFLRRGLIIRRLGSAALDLAYVACGRFDAFYEGGLSPWDSAAGSLLVREAGGKVTHFDGKEYSIYKKSIIASNGIQHEYIEELVRGESFRM
ncbi:MAG TPA: inositol monophosphatase family protein [Candidatus Kapabacteria bacterium]|nr:inositol monophosphatase family protein [Candidatus Kapabacteria bacterium]